MFLIRIFRAVNIISLIIAICAIEFGLFFQVLFLANLGCLIALENRAKTVKIGK